MPRPQKAPGDLGKVTLSQTATGWRARARIRDFGGRAFSLDVRAETAELARARLVDQANAIWGGLAKPLTPTDTIKDLAAAWLEEVQATESIGERRQTTVESHAQAVRSIILPAIGAVRLSSVTVALCNRFLLELEKTSKARAKKARTVMNQMLQLAVEHGALPANPMRDARRVRRNATQYFELSNHQLAGILRLLENWNGVNPERRGGARPDTVLLTDMILLILATSMRPGEVLALRVEDVDLDSPQPEVHVTGTVEQTARDGLRRKETPKHADQERYIPVPEFALNILRRRVHVAKAAGNSLLFATRTGGLYQLQNINRSFRAFRTANQAALVAFDVDPAELSFKSFRKAAATAVKLDGGIELASQLLGHKDFRTTQSYYAAPVRHVDSAVADALDRAFPDARRRSGD